MGTRPWPGAFPCESSHSAGKQARGPLCPHAEDGPKTWGFRAGQTGLAFRPASPAPSCPQTAAGAPSGQAVPCAVTVGVGWTVTPSVGSATVWTATWGPHAVKVSWASWGENGRALCSLTPTHCWLVQTTIPALYPQCLHGL